MMKQLIKDSIDKAVKLHSENKISTEELLMILSASAQMIPDSIKEWNTTYTPNLFEDWGIEDFKLWYEHTFKEV